jgi:hypothetical protein
MVARSGSTKRLWTQAIQSRPKYAGGCSVPAELTVEKYLELDGATVHGRAAESIVAPLHPQIQPGVLASNRETYLGAGWRAEEVEFSLRLARQMRARAQSDQGCARPTELRQERVKRLIKGCAGLVAVLPNEHVGATRGAVRS